MIDPAIAISVFALLFTIASFWWMNWRKGKLYVGSPRTYAAFGSIEGKMVLEFPFVFYNNGPLPIIVQNLRIILLDEDPAIPLNFIATETKLGNNENRSFATQFPIRGQEALLLICEFQRDPGQRIFEQMVYPIELQAVIGNSKKWKRLCKFTLNINEKDLNTINKQFVVHDNQMILTTSSTERKLS
jgi:hypothetical protein